MQSWSGNTAVIDNPTSMSESSKTFRQRNDSSGHRKLNFRVTLTSHQTNMANLQHSSSQSRHPSGSNFNHWDHRQIISLMIEGGGIGRMRNPSQYRQSDRLFHRQNPRENSRPVVGWNPPHSWHKLSPSKTWPVAKCGDDIHYSGLLNAFTPRHLR